jgi:hypothetical protein
MSPRILLLDIETAPTTAYIWDLVTRYVPHTQVAEPGFTLCWAAKWLGEKKTMYRSTHHDGESKMIDEVHALLEEADWVVHYNGTKFDIPTLNREFLQWGMSPPAPFQEIDLYRTARSRFKLLSNSMAYVAKTLDIEGKLSHKGMALWTECMAGDAAAWKIMKEYNIQDTNMLEEIYYALRPWIQPHPNMALFDDGVDPVCPTCGSSNIYIHPQEHHTQTMSYNRFRCRDCGKWSRTRKNILDKEKRDAILVGVK